MSFLKFNNKMDRRNFLKVLGVGGASLLYPHRLRGSAVEDSQTLERVIRLSEDQDAGYQDRRVSGKRRKGESKQLQVTGCKS